MTLPTTPSQTVGPFYSIGLCRRPENALLPASDPSAVPLIGVVCDGAGDSIGDAVVEIWDAGARRWGRSGTDAEGRFAFTIAKPGRQEGDAPHLEAYVFARGLLKHQLTRIYFPDEAAANEADPALSALDPDDRATLIARDDGDALRFDIRMQGDRATVFFAV